MAPQNIQIFGKSKCFDSQKAQRWFDLPKYGMSNGEYKSVKQALGGLDKLMDSESKLYEQLFIAHLAYEADKEEKLLDNPGLFKTPIVRCGKKATVGFCPEVWEAWLKD